jgi:hypothetical protein
LDAHSHHEQLIHNDAEKKSSVKRISAEIVRDYHEPIRLLWDPTGAVVSSNHHGTVELRVVSSIAIGLRSRSSFNGGSLPKGNNVQVGKVKKEAFTQCTFETNTKMDI